MMAEVQTARITLENGQVVELISPMKCPCGATAIRKKPKTVDIIVYVDMGGNPGVSKVVIGSDPTEYGDGETAHNVPIGTGIGIDAVLYGGESLDSPIWTSAGGVVVTSNLDPGAITVTAPGTLTLHVKRPA